MSPNEPSCGSLEISMSRSCGFSATGPGAAADVPEGLVDLRSLLGERAENDKFILASFWKKA